MQRPTRLRPPLDPEDDDEGLVAHQVKRQPRSTSGSGWTLDSWGDAVRAASWEPGRTFVVKHLSAGCRRGADLEDSLTRLAEEAGLKLLTLSIDLADDPVWDLS